MEPTKPTAQHEWLQKLVGTWTYEHPMGPVDGSEPPQVMRGTEVFRSVGGLWVVGEANGPMPDGSPSGSVMTLGFDPAKNRFVGTWLGTFAAYLWVYDGELDANGKILRLYADGPAMDGSGTFEPYMDVIEFIDDDHRTLSGHAKDPDGQWKAFMTGHYRRQR